MNLLRGQVFLVLTIVAFSMTVFSQSSAREFPVGAGTLIEVQNRAGRIEIIAEKESAGKVSLHTVQTAAANNLDVKVESSSGRLKIFVPPSVASNRIDLSITVPERSKIKIEGDAGEVVISGDLESIEARTGTGTIAANVPTSDIKYSLQWTASRPRVLSDFKIEDVKERSAGRFEIKGRFIDEEAAADDDTAEDGNDKKPKEKRLSKTVSLNFTTGRGIVLLNVPPNEVTGDLRERPLTNAAKAVIRSGDSILMDAIRRAAPKYYGDYARTLPPAKLEPRFAERTELERSSAASIKTASVRVTDFQNRAVSGLSIGDFEVLENNSNREIISVKRSTASVNLVLLLDVSGSIENYVNFIRKAARNFVNTVDANDRISIITFNDDVSVAEKFTSDKTLLSESLDTFDAGGATAYYDALAYTLADTLRPLKGERTAIVVLTDGDDNRSFLPFDSILSSIRESGALIYPLYVPSALIARDGGSLDSPIDSLRQRYLLGGLTSRAKGEGQKLAEVSGGVYYEISQLSQIQTAYEDIVLQLRTAYEIKYRSELAGMDSGISPRLKIRSKKPNSYTQITHISSN